MQSKKSSGPELTLRPAEELVPREDWYAFLKNVAKRIVKDAKKSILGKGYKYTDADYWEVLVFKILNDLSTGDAVNELNDLLHERTGKFPQRLGGVAPRFERMVPNESQVNAFLRAMPDWLKNTIIGRVYKAQFDAARKYHIIGDEVEVYFDFHEYDYYGNDRYPENPSIVGTFKGAGTNRARKYNELMISSGNVKLYVGLHLVEKGEPKEQWMAEMLAMLLSWDVKVKKVMADREYSTYDVLAIMQRFDIPYTGAMKKTPAIKDEVDKYLDGKCLAVVPVELEPSQAVRNDVGPIKVHAIMKSDDGKSIKQIRKALRTGKITRAQAYKQIHVFITTVEPPRDKKKLVKWGMGEIRKYRRRWRIESGFRDSDSCTPSTRARSNGAKTFAVFLDRFAFNAWQIQKGLRKRLRAVPASWRQGPTLKRFTKVTTKVHLSERSVANIPARGRFMSGSCKTFFGGES